MLQKNATASTISSDLRPPYSRLDALLSLVTDEPTVLLHLANEVRHSTLYVGVVTEQQPQGQRRRMLCGEQNGTCYAIAFVDRSLAESYLSQATKEGDLSKAIHLAEYPGLDLLQILCAQESTLGLEIIAPSFDKLVDPYWVEIMARVHETDTSSISRHDYHLIPYGGTVPKELERQLRLFCQQHPHIERLYICDDVTEPEKSDAILVIVGDRQASTINIPDLIGEVALRIGLDGWSGDVAWVLPQDEENLRRLGLDPIYAIKLP